MRRRDARPDPEADHGLRELEAALAGEPAADPDLTLLVADVRAARPEPDPQFLAALDARVHAGFAPLAAAAARRRTPWHVRLRRPEILAPGFVVACVATLVVAMSQTAGGGDDDRSSGSSSSAVARQETSAGGSDASGTALSAPSSSASSSSSSTAAPAAPGAPRAPRAVERNADLVLRPPVADVQETADGVVRATQAAGGYVQESAIETRSSSGHASFTLRIPTARLDATIAGLSKLAHVGSLSQASSDITAQTASAADRLDDARAERQALLRALGRATTDRQIASLRTRLRDNRAQIASRQGALEVERRRARLATVTVQVDGARGAAASGDSDDDGSWTPGDALHDAGRILEVAGGVALIALAVLVPLGIVAALGVLTTLALRRRRRETALDHAR
jgi:Domain of unknown function (DUF4349)